MRAALAIMGRVGQVRLVGQVGVRDVRVAIRGTFGVPIVFL